MTFQPTIESALAAYSVGDWDSAESICRTILARHRNAVEVLILLGAVTTQTGRAEEAVRFLRRATKLKPAYGRAHNYLGNALASLGSVREALICYERAVALEPNDPVAHNNLGTLLEWFGRHNEALQAYAQAIRLAPDFDEPYVNRANALWSLGRRVEALESYGKALEVNSGCIQAHYNRGVALQELGRIDAALECYDKAIEVEPTFADARWNKALLALMKGEFNEGWRLYEWRWSTSDHASSKRLFEQPLWLGEASLEGKTILLHGEQGLGDQIQFCRYAAMVQSLGASVLLEVDPKLVSIMTSLRSADLVIARGSSISGFDYHCPLMSLPFAFETNVSNIPAPIPYLRADPHKAADWAHRLGARIHPRIGIVWSGGARPNQPKHLAAAFERRNIPFQEFAEIRDQRFDFYSLQKGEPAESILSKQRNSTWPERNFFDCTDGIKDFSDTAALIQNLDLVISVDTSVAHLAGAMGKPVWILNRFDACWRWMLSRDDSPWYPTAKLYRQERAGDWASVIARVKKDLIASNLANV